MAAIPDALRPVLAGAIDYAGLFPPADLPMADAVANYAAYVAGQERWALGRFVVTGARLDEFAAHAGPMIQREPWGLSVLVRGPGEVAALSAFRHAWAGTFRLDAAEGRASNAGHVQELVRQCPPGIALFVELTIDDHLSACVEALRGTGASAKIRMGGVTADAVPSPENVVCFLRACHRADVPWKATAGLHHPVRGVYPLTYAPDSPRATMHGYLNLMAAWAAMDRGGSDADAMRWLTLEGEDFRGWTGDTLVSPHASLSFGELAAARRRLAGFGSCSFREPLDDLAGMTAS